MNSQLSEAREAIEFLNTERKKYGLGGFRATAAGTTNPVISRLKEGYSLEDIKTVISGRCKKWGQDPKMQEYLRPSTLFRVSKFPGYLADAESVTKEEPDYIQNAFKKINGAQA